MKNTIIIFLSLLSVFCKAQEIAHVDFQERNSLLVITYDLLNCPSGSLYDVSVKFINENKMEILPISVSGDLKKLSCGLGKRIEWDVLRDKPELKGSIQAIVEISKKYSTKQDCNPIEVHNANLTYGSMTDQDGNTYKTIVIGTQEWMAENLRASHYRNGDSIPVVMNDAQWQNLKTGASCWYKNDSSTFNCPYGKLYNGYAVADARNLCPVGWHIPSNAEWTTLTTFLGGVELAGGKMKSTGTLFWESPNFAADNSSGFSGLPGGYRNDGGTFYSVGNYGGWWSSSEGNTHYAWERYLSYLNGSVFRSNGDKARGLSVRCLRD